MMSGSIVLERDPALRLPSAARVVRSSVRTGRSAPDPARGRPRACGSAAGRAIQPAAVAIARARSHEGTDRPRRVSSDGEHAAVALAEHGGVVHLLGVRRRTGEGAGRRGPGQVRGGVAPVPEHASRRRPPGRPASPDDRTATTSPRPSCRTPSALRRSSHRLRSLARESARPGPGDAADGAETQVHRLETRRQRVVEHHEVPLGRHGDPEPHPHQLAFGALR